MPRRPTKRGKGLKIEIEISKNGNGTPKRMRKKPVKKTSRSRK